VIRRIFIAPYLLHSEVCSGWVTAHLLYTQSWKQSFINPRLQIYAGVRAGSKCVYCEKTQHESLLSKIFFLVGPAMAEILPQRSGFDSQSWPPPTSFKKKKKDIHTHEKLFILFAKKITLLKIRLCKHVWMEYYAFEVFTHVLWQIMMKFVPLAPVVLCVTCKQGRYTCKAGG